jgi:hypothetical protein
LWVDLQRDSWIYAWCVFHGDLGEGLRGSGASGGRSAVRYGMYVYTYIYIVEYPS